jgi:hypothetical protein
MRGMAVKRAFAGKVRMIVVMRLIVMLLRAVQRVTDLPNPSRPDQL